MPIRLPACQIRIIFYFIGLFLSIRPILSQNMIFTNPGDIYNSRAGFLNPALISFQESRVSFGMNALHVGFLEDHTLAFKNGYCAASLPYLLRGNVGVGVNGQYFNSPLYTQNNFSLAVSKKYFRRFSIGLRASLFTKSYNRALFDLEDEADPVFAGGTTKYAVSLGGGLFVSILPHFFLTLAAEHINQPNVALAEAKFKQPMEVYGGLKYGFNHFGSAFYFKKVASDFYPFFEIEPNFSEAWQIRLSYGMKSLQFDGAVNLFSGMSLEYFYNYPFSDFYGASFGSHGLSLTYYLDKKPSVPEQLAADACELPFELRENDLHFESRFEVYSSVTSLEIIEKRIYRRIEADLDAEALEYLINFELGELDSAANGEAQFFDTREIGAYYPEIRRLGNFTGLYQTTLEKIDSLMAENKNLRTEIIAAQKAGNRAAGLQNYLLNRSGIEREQVAVVLPVFKNPVDSLTKRQKISINQIRPVETLTVVTHDSTTFRIFPVYMENYVRPWKLRIMDADQVIVKEFQGDGSIPGRIIWDWRKDDQTFIEPGLYYYTFHWVDPDNHPRVSNPRIIDVRKIKRNLTVTVSKSPRLLEENVKKIGIRLNR